MNNYKRPRRITIEEAVATINDVDRGNPRRNPGQVTESDFNDLRVMGNLVNVKDLLPFFGNKKYFQKFKDELAYRRPKPASAKKRSSRSKSPSPSRSKSPPKRSKSPPKRRGRPRTRRVLRLKSKLGTFSDDDIRSSDDEDSFLSIEPANDEYDDTDVNLPGTVCQGFRRVCRNYGPGNRYVKFEPDSSENYLYNLDLKYN